MRIRMAPTAHYASWITSLAFTVTAEVEPGRSLPTVAAPTDPAPCGRRRPQPRRGRASAKRSGGQN